AVAGSRYTPLPTTALIDNPRTCQRPTARSRSMGKGGGCGASRIVDPLRIGRSPYPLARATQSQHRFVVRRPINQVEWRLRDSDLHEGRRLPRERADKVSTESPGS